MYTETDITNLSYALLNEIGLCIDSKQNLVDQDTMNPITFQGKNIKAAIDPLKPVYLTEHDIKLDPLNKSNVRLMSTLFGYFIDKEQEAGNIPRVITFYLEDSPDKSSTKICVVCEGNITYWSEYFCNKCLMYCDIIFKIGGSINNRIDLRVFDSIETGDR